MTALSAGRPGLSSRAHHFDQATGTYRADGCEIAHDHRPLAAGKAGVSLSRTRSSTAQPLL